ncbi:uracil-DNA glycosylase family protein [Parachryseolinea silvisoli]|uniref:uracil-DNA glycosylase family protein n=1 Tax=Parachryseolinea silvisoli TaxID=2873601 RepID=UPI002265F5CA|nr:uracil-DNA glycosylase family protein [Parachryseolinea silvisoli]MCD9015405.1 DUF4918 family protein [Parachryseolinea silvisoli]
MSFADKILTFYRSLALPTLPAGVEAMNPYQDSTAYDLSEQFYRRFYSDDKPRRIIMGINPGRFGGGLTGVPFTDPLKLEQRFGIQNDLKKKVELSADFIYTMIDAYGGPKKFYSRYYINSVCPLGFMRDGKNLNYYDIRELQDAIEPFVVDSIKRQLDFGIDRKAAYCLGEGKNFAYLEKLNGQHGFFKEIVPLSHPRFIMQYKRKHIPAYVADYLKKLK